MVTTEEKEFFQRLASMSGWNIADEFGIHYSGDSNPIPHGGFFYNVGNWEKEGYADVVEFWDDHEHKCQVVQQGTIHKPKTEAEWESVWSSIGCEANDEIRNNIHAQIEAVRCHSGIMPKGITYPYLKDFDLETWAEWRIWRSIAGMLKELGE